MFVFVLFIGTDEGSYITHICLKLSDHPRDAVRFRANGTVQNELCSLNLATRLHKLSHICQMIARKHCCFRYVSIRGA